MISIYLAEDLEQSVKHSQNTILLQYFCDNKDERRNTATAILRGLIFQLLQIRPHLFTHILPSYRVQKVGLFLASSFQTLWRIFESMLRDPGLGKTYCVLDGVDECEKDSLSMILEKFRELFSNKLQSPQAFQFNLMVASRDEPKAISQLLSGFTRIRLDPDAKTEINQDINCFIEAKVNELSKLEQYPPQLSEHIKKKFRERVQGTFLWVGIVANNLRNYSKTEVVKYLDEFPPGLDEVYARILLQIGTHRRDIVAKILRWVVMAVRPITLAELSVAIDASDDPSTTHLSATEIAEDQISWCGDFLTITRNKIKLVHQSAKDYLLRQDVDSKPELEFFRVKEEIANLEIASKCFYYLQEGALAGGPVHLKKDASRLKKFPLLSYATLYWPVHASLLARSADMFQLSNPFYQKTSKIRDSWLQNYSDAMWWQDPEPWSTLLHTVSYFGILPLAENLLQEHISSLGEQDSCGRTALHIAVERGHQKMVQLFSSTGVDVDKRDKKGRTALYTAATSGHETMTRVLLQNGADINIKCGTEHRQTALHSASRPGHKPMVQLLLSNGADIEAKNDLSSTPLHIAARNGSNVVVQLLLDNGADIHAKNVYDESALHVAAQDGHDAVVQLLLSNGADIQAKNNDGKSALHTAIRRGQDIVVLLLLNNGADVEAKSSIGETALHIAAKEGNGVVVWLLLKIRADIETKDKNQKTALHYAAARAWPRRGYECTVRLLLEDGADIEAKDKDQRTALHYAAGGCKVENENIVRLLLESGANASAKNSSGRTPLDLAKRKLFNEDSETHKIRQAIVQLLSWSEDSDEEDSDEKHKIRQSVVQLLSSSESKLQDRVPMRKRRKTSKS